MYNKSKFGVLLYIPVHDSVLNDISPLRFYENNIRDQEVAA